VCEFDREQELLNVNMSLDKFAEGAMLQKEMERLEIEEKNDDSQR